MAAILSRPQCAEINKKWQVDGLVQDRRNSIANALELRLSCTKSSKCYNVTGDTVKPLI